MRTIHTALVAAAFVAAVAHAASPPSAAASAASAPDPLQSVQCRKAMEALERQQAASAPRDGKRDDAELERDALRQQAARACLGGKGDAPPPKQVGRAPVAPITVQPVSRGLPPLPPSPAPVVAAPAAAPPPPAVVTACDTAGCWASDGTRLQRSGPVFVAPGALCRVEAGVVRCP